MRNDWILDVLTDLRAHAQTNDLPNTAAGAEVLLRLAQAEIAARPSDKDDGGGGGGGGGTRQSPPS